MSEARRLLERTARKFHKMAYPIAIGHALEFEDCPIEVCAEARAYLAQPITKCEEREGELVAALKAQKAAHDYRFGPAGEEAETGEEINAFMYKAQELDETAWQLTRAALAPDSGEPIT
ncbi:hypothetical protein LCGC14_1216790 [marine sediment metagenome]|uniref:Uncharacterized protein n=1 Tax=marine sediment metagenome TaxID=412755 RepID=A0A0F9LGJ4_9ZZZZ